MANIECPFCKELKLCFHKQEDYEKRVVEAYIFCTYCEARGPATFSWHIGDVTDDDLYEMALDLWNTRGMEENG